MRPPAAAGSPWRLLAGGTPGSDDPSDLPTADGPTNMAVDRALLESVIGGAGPVLRLYRWDPPTLSFGRNQPAAGRYHEEAARARGIAFVRRPTGGQAVLHADELTYAVVAPVEALGRPREAYRRVNRGLVEGLRRLGVDAAVAGAVVGAGARPDGSARGDARPLDWAAACFRDPAEGEVVAGGRKLVGSAQRCEGRVILQHGSILVSGSQAAAEELLRERDAMPPRGSDAGWTTLEAELGRRPAWPSLVEALVAGVRQVLGTALAPADLSDDESARARELRARFASPEWTWRR